MDGIVTDLLSDGLGWGRAVRLEYICILFSVSIQISIIVLFLHISIPKSRQGIHKPTTLGRDLELEITGLGDGAASATLIGLPDSWSSAVPCLDPFPLEWGSGVPAVTSMLCPAQHCKAIICTHYTPFCRVGNWLLYVYGFPWWLRG